MKSFLHHLQLNINSENLEFYIKLMEKLGLEVLAKDEGYAGFHLDSKLSIWFMPKTAETNNDYDGVGLNHTSFGANSVAEVDEVVNWLREQNIPLLFDTPRHREDFAMSEDETYYQVMFESPDKLLFEIVYTGKK